MTAAAIILAAIIGSGVIMFVLGACRVSGIADDTAEQIARQLAETDRFTTPTINQPQGD